jgi:hypothetical protein
MLLHLQGVGKGRGEMDQQQQQEEQQQQQEEQEEWWGEG